jgi:hypothetical protein
VTGQILSFVDVGAAFSAASDLGALAPWGTDFYFFDSNGNVTRYTPGTGVTTLLTTLPGANFVAAATSGCALQ